MHSLSGFRSALLAAVLVMAVGCGQGGEGERAAPGDSAAVATALVSRAAPGDSAEVAATVGRYHAALAAGDSTGAIALLTPDVEILESGGKEDLAEYRSHHLSADIGYARAVTTQRSATRVRVQGDVAWATSTSTSTGTFRMRPIDATGAELMVLVRTPQGWQIAAIHWSSRDRTA